MKSEKRDCPPAGTGRPQRIAVFQQNGSGETKIAGIRHYGGDRYRIEVHDLPGDLPPVLDETSAYLPGDFEADLVLDFLTHPDLTDDLADLCAARSIPVVASGRKSTRKGVLTPPT